MQQSHILLSNLKILPKHRCVYLLISLRTNRSRNLCRLYLHRITSTVISELTRGQIRPKLDHDDVDLLLAHGAAKASLLAE